MPQAGRPLSYRQLAGLRGQELAGHVARSYWLTRYVEETQPGLLKQAFASRKAARGVDGMLAKA